MTATRALRLLCLHGMYQDAVTFAAKTKPLRGASAGVDFVFLDGPFTIVPPILARQSKRPSASSAAASKPKRVRCAKKKTEFRAWWRPLGIHQEDPGSLDEDRDVLVRFLREKLDEVGDVDGVVGFSQGASLAAWMCSEQVRSVLGKG
jgi:predicted esterase